MQEKSPNIIFPVVAAFVGLVALVGSVVYYGSQWMLPEANSIVMTLTPSSTPVLTTSVAVSSTTTISDMTEPKLFEEFEYEAAKLANKTILLYFTASWCPECDYGRRRLAEAVAVWPSEQVAAFLVDYVKEAATSTAAEARLSEAFQVTAPDTKVLLRGEQLIKKSTEVWSLERFQEELTALLK